MCKHNICSVGLPMLGTCQHEAQHCLLDPTPAPWGSAAVLAAVQEGSEVHEPPASRLRTAVSEPKVEILWLCRDVSRDWQAEADGLCQGTSPACP